jgi:Spy/CpxP family protein refolding chaperone
MKRAVALLGLGLVLFASVAVAQQQTPAQPGHMPGHQHMHGGMCPMMGGGMMGTMGGQSESPRMMQMRGEMMKAMGEVMIKYGKAMEGAGR